LLSFCYVFYPIDSDGFNIYIQNRREVKPVQLRNIIQLGFNEIGNIVHSGFESTTWIAERNSKKLTCVQEAFNRGPLKKRGLFEEEKEESANQSILISTMNADIRQNRYIAYPLYESMFGIGECHD